MIEEKKYKTLKNKFLIDWIVPILVAVFAVIILNNFIVFTVKVSTLSMFPTLNTGDRLLVSRVYNLENLSRGDLIVFYYEPMDQLFVKRLVGLPNDKISINDGVVSINGEILEESYVQNNMVFNQEFEVPKNKLFFLGDNRNNSFDSRFWDNSYINYKDVKGKVLFRIYHSTK